MKLFANYPHYAYILSIFINVIIAVLGVVPSVFLTAANVLFFGFWQGTFISFLGESIGAFIAFILYRTGFKKSVENKFKKNAALDRLLQAKGKEAFFAIIPLRLIPFIPSGLITFTAAIGKVSAVTFFVASSLGKMPALLFESYAAYEVTEFKWQGKVILLVVGVYLLYWLFTREKR